MKIETTIALPAKWLYVIPAVSAALGLAIVAAFSELHALALFSGIAFLIASLHPRIRLWSLILLMPFVYSGIGIELKGFGIFDLYAGLFILLFVLRKCREGLRFDRVPALGWTAIMFIAFMPSLLNTVNYRTSIIGFLRFLYPIMLAWALYETVLPQRSIKLVKSILHLFVIETVLIGLYGIYDAYAHRSLLSAFIGRIQFGLFPEVNYYASYLMLAVPLTYALLLAEKGRRRKWFFLSALVCLFFAIVLTVSRSAMVAMLIVFIVFTFYMFRKLSGIKKLFSIGLLAILLTMVGLMVFTETGRKTVDVIALVHRVQSAFSGRDVSFKQRLTILEIATRMVADHPVIGVGFGTFEQTFNDYQRGNFSTQSARSAHNTPLRMLAETGIIGFLAGAIFIVSLFRYLFSALRAVTSPYWKTTLFGLIMSLLSFLLLSLALDQLNDPPFWIITALALVVATFAHEGILDSPREFVVLSRAEPGDEMPEPEGDAHKAPQ
ncbi:MAG: O-antigen ligase family protein [candidate division KSB1 bacterium]|nr:O-antigen ligase family protein [candidate division KSB1 bacterium]MDZ7301018.1 O-antigen ligase family protein [candidate division KSB1 bacterium]MDZ7310304.1 O-antigen ligase family protein [candidate division KSB1 bacterium]